MNKVTETDVAKAIDENWKGREMPFEYNRLEYYGRGDLTVFHSIVTPRSNMDLEDLSDEIVSQAKKLISGVLHDSRFVLEDTPVVRIPSNGSITGFFKGSAVYSFGVVFPKECKIKDKLIVNGKIEKEEE